VTAICWSMPPPVGVAVGAGKVGGAPARSGAGSPNVQPPASSAAVRTMPAVAVVARRDGRWRDVVLMERRSPVVD